MLQTQRTDDRASDRGESGDGGDSGSARLPSGNVSLPSDGLQLRSRPEKLLHKWLDGSHSDEVGQRLKCVLWGPGGVGKSTLALKFAVGKAERSDWC